MTDTGTVTVEVIELLPAPSRGRLIAWATVELVVDGILVVLQGVQVMRRRGGRAEAAMPTCRAPGGDLVPAVVLPGELEEAVMRALLAEFSPSPVALSAFCET